MSESVPPASITSASPRWIARKASPTAWLLAAQAVVGLKIGPRAPVRMDTHPAAMLGRLPGSAYALTPSMPSRWSVSHELRSMGTPPMPVPTDTPTRSFCPSTLTPESASAVWAQIRA